MHAFQQRPAGDVDGADEGVERQLLRRRDAGGGGGRQHPQQFGQVGRGVGHGRAAGALERLGRFVDVGRLVKHWPMSSQHNVKTTSSIFRPEIRLKKKQKTKPKRQRRVGTCLNDWTIGAGS